jgi:hypothetical protein
MASIRGLRPGLTRKNGHSHQLEPSPPIQSRPTDEVLLTRCHLIGSSVVLRLLLARSGSQPSPRRLP